MMCVWWNVHVVKERVRIRMCIRLGIQAMKDYALKPDVSNRNWVWCLHHCQILWCLGPRCGRVLFRRCKAECCSKIRWVTCCIGAWLWNLGIDRVLLLMARYYAMSSVVGTYSAWGWCALCAALHELAYTCWNVAMISAWPSWMCA